MGSFTSARIFNRFTSFLKPANLASLDACPPLISEASDFSNRAIFSRPARILASLSSRSAARIFRASWNAWYGRCSKGMSCVLRIASRLLLDPIGHFPSFISCASNLADTVLGSRSKGLGSGEGLAATPCSFTSAARDAPVVNDRRAHDGCRRCLTSGRATAGHRDIIVRLCLGQFCLGRKAKLRMRCSLFAG